jgi:hypothetical protein
VGAGEGELHFVIAGAGCPKRLERLLIE